MKLERKVVRNVYFAMRYIRSHLSLGYVLRMKQCEIIKTFAESLGYDVSGFGRKPLSLWLSNMWESKEIELFKRLEVNFYLSREWRGIRKSVLSKFGAVCLCCGSKENIHVDHIYPLSLYPERKLDFDNLQPLCRSCNAKKSNRTIKDYRVSLPRLQLTCSGY